MLKEMLPSPNVGASKELTDADAWQGRGATKGLVEVVSESDNWLNPTAQQSINQSVFSK